MTNAAILARVSTTRQAEEGLSMDDQVRRGRELADRNGWAVHDRHVFREGISGAAKSRPVIDAVLEAAERGEFTVLIARHVDRIGRSARDTLAIFDRLDAAGVEIYGDAGQRYSKDDPGAEFTRTVLIAAAEYERSMISERVARMTPGKRARGSYNGGPRPYGYDYGDGGLVVNEAEAEIVRRIFREYNEGVGVKEIARRLNDEGKRGPLGGSWTATRVGDRLDLPLYAGIVGGGAQGRHKAIIDAETWKRTCDLRSASRERHGKAIAGRRSNTHLLGNGLLRCECGASFYPRKDTRSARDTYRCRGRDERSTDCDMPPIPRRSVDDAVRAFIASEVLSPGMARGEIEAEAKKAAKDATKVATAAEREATKIAQKLDKGRRSMLDDDPPFSSAEWKALRAELEAELTDAKRRAADAKKLANDLRNPSVDLVAAVDAIRQAARAEAPDGATLAAQRAAIERIFECFEVIAAPAEDTEDATEIEDPAVAALVAQQAADNDEETAKIPTFTFKVRQRPLMQAWIVPVPRPEIAERFGGIPLDSLREIGPGTVSQKDRKGLPYRTFGCIALSL